MEGEVWSLSSVSRYILYVFHCTGRPRLERVVRGTVRSLVTDDTDKPLLSMAWLFFFDSTGEARAAKMGRRR